MTLTTFYVAVDPDGTCTRVPATFAGIKQGLHDATFDLVILDAGHAFFVDDEGMLNGGALNVPASILTGMALFGPVVLTGGTDAEGDTMCPTVEVAGALEAAAEQWRSVAASAADNGQDITVIANPNTLPAPGVIGLSDDEFAGWLNGDQDTIDALHQRLRDERSR